MATDVVKQHKKVKEITTGIMVYYGHKLWQHGEKASIKPMDRLVTQGLLKNEQYTKAQVLIFALGEAIKQIANNTKKDIDVDAIDALIKNIVIDIDPNN